MANLNERLIELRNKNNLLQKDVATAINLSVVGYQRYEYGTREPAYKNLLALADYFDVSLDYLVGRTDNPNSHKS